MGTLQVWGWVVNLFSSKKLDSSSFKAYTHKTCIIKQKIKTCQKLSSREKSTLLTMQGWISLQDRAAELL